MNSVASWCSITRYVSCLFFTLFMVFHSELSDFMIIYVVGNSQVSLWPKTRNVSQFIIILTWPSWLADTGWPSAHVFTRPSICLHSILALKCSEVQDSGTKSSTKNSSKYYLCKHRTNFILLGSGACRVKTLLILPLVYELQPLEHDAAYFGLGGFPWSSVVKPNVAISVG